MSEEQYIIPSSPADRLKVKQAVIQISNAMDRARGEKEFISETKKTIKEEIGIPPKVLGQMAKDYNEQQFEKRLRENEEYEALYETILKSTGNGAEEDEESEE